jgi:ribose transport system substrate-binding protein
MARKDPRTRSRVRLVAFMAAAAVVAVAVVTSGATGARSAKTLRIAYLSFAVANSYDSPMLAAAQATAIAENAKLTVFDANNSTDTQFQQLQDVITGGTKRWDGVIVQPIFGPNLIGLVKKAIKAGIKVGNMDQILGANLATSKSQVPGLSANVVFVPFDMGTKLGKMTVAACKKIGHKPCKVAYMYGVKASGVDKAVRDGLNKQVKAAGNIQVVAEGESFFSIQGGLTAMQDILQAHPDIDVLAGNEQSVEGGSEAIKAAGVKKGKILLISWGGAAIGLTALKAGERFADPITLPASEGRLAAHDLIAAIRTGKNQPSRDVLAGLPYGGIATKATASKFIPEWQG